MKKCKLILSLLALLALSLTSAQAQRMLTGKVLDTETKEPLIGANILVTGTNTGTIVDYDGNYELELPEGNVSITVSYTGYESKIITDVQPGVLNIDLSAGSVLDEVVVVGYTTQKKGDITGAVSVVDVDAVSKTPYSNVLQALQGKVSGIQLTQDGQPGSGRTSIKIRGVTTLNNNNPLYVVDGIPTTEDLNNLNPNDIESIQVLKDAASASIYGSRSAGGVIVITTKKGKAGKISVDAGMLSGVQTISRKIELLDPVQWGEVWWTASENAGITPKHPAYGSGAEPVLVTNPFIIPNGRQIYQYTPEGTDWYDQVYQNAFQQQYYVNVNGGNDRGAYSLGINYFDQEGLIRHTNFNRITTRLNTSFKITDWLTVGENLSVALYDQVQIGSQQGQDGIPLDVIRQHPALPVYDLEGGYAGKIAGFPDVRNMVSVLEKNKDNTTDSRRIFGNAYVEADLFKMLHLLGDAHSLKLKTTYGLDYGTFFDRRFQAAFQEGDFDIQNNLLFNQYGVGTTQTWINTLEYNFEQGDHALKLLGGHEQVAYDFQFIGGARTDFENEDPAFTYLNAGAGEQTNVGGGTEWALRSYFGRTDYTLKNRYILSATLRFDETSRLLTNGIFPAASIGWRISEEPFFKNTLGNVIGDLKLRASWGQQGNQQVGDFSTVSILGADVNHADYDLLGTNNQVLQGFRVLSRGNPNLVWETTTQTNFGFDAGFWNGKLTIGADYYIKNTEDILLRAPQIAAIGEGDEPFVNAAEVKNKGIDLLIGYNNSIPRKNLRYDLSFQFSHFTNEVVSLGQNIGNTGNAGERYLNGSDGPTRITVGYPIGVFYGWEADGIFQNQAEVDAHAEQTGKDVGRIRYADLNNDGVVNELDRTYIGDPYPDFSFGLDGSVEWKGLTFSASLYSAIGQDVYNEVLWYTDFAQNGTFNHSTRILDAWSRENTGSSIPAPTLENANNENRASSYFVEDGSYLRLRSVKLGYTLPKSLTGQVTASIYGEVQNVATLTGYSGIDPEVPYAGNVNFPGIDRGVYPLPRTFLLGVNFKF
ncbi:MAG: TonB-dependent receptor [Saprospiraceae bacterium]|nr:TonB-dependent receptor [Saprospiraceae bacterium]